MSSECDKCEEHCLDCIEEGCIDGCRKPTELEEVQNQEIEILRREIADEWHVKHFKSLAKVDKFIGFAKDVFIYLPVWARHGRTSEDILWENFDYIREEFSDKWNGSALRIGCQILLK